MSCDLNAHNLHLYKSACFTSRNIKFVITVVPLLLDPPFTMEKDLTTRMTSLQGDYLVIFYYLSAFDIWPDI